MADDRDGRDAGQSGSHQQLSSVRNESLDEAGECVEDAGALAGIQLETLGDVLGNAARSDDGDGVVRRAEIGQADKCRDAEFSSSLPFDAFCQSFDNEVNTTVFPDYFQLFLLLLQFFCFQRF